MHPIKQKQIPKDRLVFPKLKNCLDKRFYYSSEHPLIEWNYLMLI
jgi:hypothetical protein